jgi:alpha-N-acetylglucosaminidase
MFNASKTNPSLWDNPSYQYDMTDITRQVMSNSFIDIYTSLISAYISPSPSNATLASIGKNLTTLLNTLDSVLLTNPAFSLSTWLSAARSQASNPNSKIADFYEYEARNQITLWGPNGEISDYASKSWGGLVKGYYLPRWEIFLAYLGETTTEGYNVTELDRRLRGFEMGWQNETVAEMAALGDVVSLQDVLVGLEGNLPGVF